MPPPTTALPRYWFGPLPELEPNEEWVAHRPANRTQGKRAVGGGLHFTSQRVLFCANVVDAALGGRGWRCSLRDVAEARPEPARFSLFELFSGGLRTRLRIELRDGSHQLFVVSNVAAVTEELNALIASGETG